VRHGGGSRKQRLKNTVIYVALAGLLKLLRMLPEKMACGIMAGLGRLAFRLSRSEREKAIRHLTRVYGDKKTPEEIRQIGRKVFENLGLNSCAAIRTPNYLRRGIEKWVRVEGWEHLEQAYAGGRGVLALAGHLGSWELLAAYLANTGFRLAVVGKPGYDLRLDRIVVRGRERAGMRYFASEGAARKMLHWLKSGGMLGVLIDLDTPVANEFVDFMGRPASTPIAPMILAQRAGASIVPVAIHREPDSTHVITVLPEVDLEPDDGTRETRQRNLQRCSKAVEHLILRYPEQWVWMHERWKTRPGRSSRVPRKVDPVPTAFERGIAPG